MVKGPINPTLQEVALTPPAVKEIVNIKCLIGGAVKQFKNTGVGLPLSGALQRPPERPGQPELAELCNKNKCIAPATFRPFALIANETHFNPVLLSLPNLNYYSCAIHFVLRPPVTPKTGPRSNLRIKSYSFVCVRDYLTIINVFVLMISVH